MSRKAPQKPRPHIVWAFWHGRALNLRAHERLILMAIAERTDADLSSAPTQAVLAEDTGLSARTVKQAVKELLERKDAAGNALCIETERHRASLRYKLKRPLETPIVAPSASADSALSKPLRSANFALPEVQISHFTKPLEVQISHFPLRKTPLLTRLGTSPVNVPSPVSTARAGERGFLPVSRTATLEERMAIGTTVPEWSWDVKRWGFVKPAPVAKTTAAHLAALSAIGTPGPDGRVYVGAYDLGYTVERVCQIVRMDFTRATQKDFAIVGGWLNDGIETPDIIAAVQKRVDRGDCGGVYSLAYFDKPVRMFRQDKTRVRGDSC